MIVLLVLTGSYRWAAFVPQVKRLIEKKANLNAKNNDERTALMLAAEGGKLGAAGACPRICMHCCHLWSHYRHLWPQHCPL
eukprot:519337-Rhodomonas_salina.1